MSWKHHYWRPDDIDALTTLVQGRSTLADLADAGTRLVLDGVGEIEHEGQYVSGADFAELANLLRPATDLRRPEVPAVTSEAEAIRFAASLPSSARSRSLYRAGSMIRNCDLRALLGADPASFLGLDDLQLEQRGWTSSTPREPHATWKVFRRTGGPTGGSDQPVWKLYVSPEIREMPRVFSLLPDLLDEFASTGVAFKCAYDPVEFGRPDKLVVYALSRSVHGAIAQKLDAALDGTPSHGVLFAGRLRPDRLLSWGVDPPRRFWLHGRAESWRTWLLASVLRSIQSWSESRRAIDPAAFVQLRLDLEDIDDWAPSDRLVADFEAGSS